MKQDGDEEAKRRAGRQAAERVVDGMVVGLGTGTTAAHAIRAIGEAVDAGLDVTGIATSYQSRDLAREVGIPLTGLDAATPDLAIDGADQVVGGDLLKGGGAAHAREKVVDAAAAEFLVVVDRRKLSETIDLPIPVAVLPTAREPVASTVRDLGGDPTLRPATEKDGPVVTDDGNLVLDCDFGTVREPASLAATLAQLPGVVEHGLFVDLADAILVGHEDGVEVRAV